MAKISYTPGPQSEVTSAVTSASQNLESGGCCIYLGSSRVDCTLDEIEDMVAETGSFVEALESIAARALGGVVEDVPKPPPAPLPLEPPRERNDAPRGLDAPGTPSRSPHEPKPEE